jgi:MYXO-CTERM domain-containing protein
MENMRNWGFCRAIATLGVVAAAGVTSTALAATHRVNSDEALYLATRSVKPGDIVEIEGGRTYKGRQFFEVAGTEKAPITVRGVPKDGKRPIIAGGDSTIYVSADHYVFESIEVTGGTSRCFFIEAHDVTLRDMVVHGCAHHGLLAADYRTGTIVIERSEFYDSGEGGRHHQIYVASDQVNHPGSVFRLQHSYIHDGNGGNNVKSRCERNEIYFNWIEGARYHELELIGPDVDNPPDRREDSDVVGNVLVKGNPEAHGIRLGGDGTMDTDGRYRLVNNTFVMMNGDRSAIRLFEGIESLELYNNAFVSAAGGPVILMRTDRVEWTRGKGLIVGSHNFIPSGSSMVPSELVDTVGGGHAGFGDLAAHDLRPKAGSLLVDAGTSTMPTHRDAPFPRPLASASHHPPMATLGAVRARSVRGAVDIGAFEQGATAEATAPTPVPPVARSMPAPVSAPAGSSAPAAGRSRCQCSLPGGTEGGSENTAPWLLGLMLAALRRRR